MLEFKEADEDSLAATGNQLPIAQLFYFIYRLFPAALPPKAVDKMLRVALSLCDWFIFLGSPSF